MSDPSEHGATQRVHARVGVDRVRLLEDELSTSDLTTLLLSVVAARAGRVAAGRLLSQTTDDRFTRPAACDPRAVAAVEHRIWQLLPTRFEALELSPLAPLGVCSAVAGVAQNRVVGSSNLRGK